MTADSVRFREIYSSCLKAVHAYCRRRIDADLVDDVTADVFLVAWRKIDQVPDGNATLPWLYRVAYGEITNTWRGVSRQKRFRQRLEGIGAGTPAPPDEVVVMRHEAQLIVEAMAQLSDSHREVLRLSVWEGLSNSELAVALDVSTDAAKQRLSRARRDLVVAYNRLDSGTYPSFVAREGGAQ